jgi:hypothetical protein
MEINQAELFGKGLTRADKLQKSFLGGARFGAFGFGPNLAIIGFQAANAGPGGFVPAIIGQSAAQAVGIPIAGFAAAAVSLIPGVGPLAAAVVGSMVAGYADVRMGASFANKVRWFTDLNRRIRHVEMGGSYQDTLTAKRQRLRALQDMNSAMIPGRRYLGQEALIMHR